MSELLRIEWKWYWRVGNDGQADCGIFAEPHPGHAYAIYRCPRYVKEKQWSEFATHICNWHNSTLSGAGQTNKEATLHLAAPAARCSLGGAP